MHAKHNSFSVATRSLSQGPRQNHVEVDHGDRPTPDPMFPSTQTHRHRNRDILHTKFLTCQEWLPTQAKSAHLSPDCAGRVQPALASPGETRWISSVTSGSAPRRRYQLAVQRGDRRLGQQVGARHPGQALEPAQVPHDRGQSRRDDRRIERRQQHHEHQPAEGHPQPAIRGAGNGGTCGYGVHSSARHLAQRTKGTTR